MAKLYNLARVITATVGAGTITLGAAVQGFLTFAGAGVQNGDVVPYAIRDGANSETGIGTYSSAGLTLTRTVRKSTNGGSAVSLSGDAEVFIAPSAEDFAPTSDKVWYASKNGLSASSSDNTTALNTLLQTVYAAGGGVIVLDGLFRCDGQILLPNNGATTYPKQNAIRITGFGAPADGVWETPPTPTSGLDLRYNASTGKVQTLGAGRLEVDHIAIKNGGTDTSPFFFVTQTTVVLHDCTFYGSASRNDLIVFGGTGTALDETTSSIFQGYGTGVWRCWFHNIRRGGIFHGAANGIFYAHNTASLTCGDSATKAITTATNANPAVLTAAGHGFAVGDLIVLKIAGFAGNWTPLNGNTMSVTPIDANTFSAAVDSTAFGAMSGSPVYPDGAFLEFLGNASYGTGGCDVSNNLIETTNYAYFATLAYSDEHIFSNNQFWDSSQGRTIAWIKAASTHSGGRLQHGYRSHGINPIVGAGAATIEVAGDTYSDPTTGEFGFFRGAKKFTGAVTLTGGITGSGGFAWTGGASFATLTINGALTGTGGALNWTGLGTFSSGVTATGGDFTTGAGNQFTTTSRSKLFSNADGEFTVWNNAQTNFTALNFGGSNDVAFPQLRRSGTSLKVRLSDNSADAPFTAAAITGSGAVKSSSATAGVGYATGAGGTIAQGSGSGKATGVTLDKVSGTITMDNAALNAGVEVSFTLTNSAIAATDVVHVIHSSAGTGGAYFAQCTAVAGGSCQITVSNVSAGNLSEAIVLTFIVLKAVAA